MTIVGVQEAGKSHSVRVIVENCLVSPFAVTSEPISTVVFHFDGGAAAMCELAGLASVVENVVVLTSPYYEIQSKETYTCYSGCKCIPLRLPWSTLTVNDLLRLMRLEVDQQGLERCAKTKSAKLVIFDEAHKYLSDAVNDPLSDVVVSCVRQMRHKNMRILISTQSPCTLPAEVLELSSATLVHHFTSRDFFDNLKKRMLLDESNFKDIVQLRTGQALVVSQKWKDKSQSPYRAIRENSPVLVRVRPTVTDDLGASLLAK